MVFENDYVSTEWHTAYRSQQTVDFLQTNIRDLAESETGLPAHIKPGKLFHLGSFATAYLTF